MGWTMFKSMDRLRTMERSATASETWWLSENKYEIWPPNAKQRTEHNTPITADTTSTTFMENLTASASPFPNSFATRTLH